MIKIAAYIIVIIFSLISIYQLLLIIGLPLGRAAWGGKYRVLPVKYRFGSLLAIIILLFGAYVFLQAGEIIALQLNQSWISGFVWFFTAYLALNTLGNIASKSKYEKWIMTPLSFVAFASGLIVIVMR